MERVGVKTYRAKDFSPEGVGYEVASFLSEYDDGEFCTLEEDVGISSQKIFENIELGNELYFEASKLFPDRYISRTIEPEYSEETYFYKTSHPVNFSIAHKLGFGVVRILEGEERGGYMMYHFDNLGVDSLDLQEEEALQKYLRLTIF